MKSAITLSESVKRLQTPDTLRAMGFILPDADSRPVAKPAKSSADKMTKTEARYLREVLRPQEYAGDISGIVFQPMIIRLANGHRYTPDFGFIAGGRAHYVEVKGSYRLHSYQRARLAFDQAAVEWPCFVWIWAELGKNGEWITINRGETTKQEVCR